MSQVNILIAEDFPAFRELIRSELSQRPEFQVVAVPDGVAAVEHAARLRPDVVVLDVGLPGLDGLAAAQRIRAAVPESLILFVSEEAAPEVMEKALSLGSKGYVHKTRARYLVPLVDAILDGRAGAASDRSGHAAATAHYDHRAEFCSDDTTWLESAERHLGAALRASNAAIAVATPARMQALVERLEASGIDVDHCREEGTFVQWNAAKLAAAVRSEGVAQCAPELTQIVASTIKATRSPGARVAIYSELAPILWSAGETELALELEQFGADLVGIPADIVCAYPVPPLRDAARFKSLCAHHRAIIIR